MSNSDNTFWGHVEVLRWMIIRCLIVLVTVAIATFCFKDWLFNDVVLMPLSQNFLTYRAFCKLATWLNMPSLCPSIEQINIININLASQFFIHMEIAGVMALLIMFPYLILEVWFFVRPALYSNERSAGITGAISFVVLFFAGVLVSYFIIFPLTLNFLGNYQVSESVANQISLNSYISTFLMLTLLLGIMFEMPIVAYFFARIGMLSSSFLKRYRKVALVVILILAAIITPSADAFTMMLVVIPLWLLYELSRIVVKKVEKKHSDDHLPD